MRIVSVHPQPPKPEYCMPFVPAFFVEDAKLVFLAGCGPVPPYHKYPHDLEEESGWMEGSIREQAEKTFEHIRMIHGAVGADLHNVVKA